MTTTIITRATSRTRKRRPAHVTERASRVRHAPARATSRPRVDKLKRLKHQPRRIRARVAMHTRQHGCHVVCALVVVARVARVVVNTGGDVLCARASLRRCKSIHLMPSSSSYLSRIWRRGAGECVELFIARAFEGDVRAAHRAAGSGVHEARASKSDYSNLPVHCVRYIRRLCDQDVTRDGGARWRWEVKEFYGICGIAYGGAAERARDDGGESFARAREDGARSIERAQR